MSERIGLTHKNLRESVQKAANALLQGGVILYPTDTLYGLGADAFSDEAVDKVYEIKGRDEKKPTHCIVADTEMAEKYAEVTADARLLFERLLPGGLTIILKKKAGVEGGIARGIATIGIRIPKNEFCLQLARAFGKPFTATSANLAGREHERNVDSILEQLSHSSISRPTEQSFGRVQKTRIDLIIDAGELPASPPSTVVDLSGEEPMILREGVIPSADIWNAIRDTRDN